MLLRNNPRLFLTLSRRSLSSVVNDLLLILDPFLHIDLLGKYDSNRSRPILC